MKNSLHGRVALVAGATRGAGRGIAIELGTLGATVYCTGRTTRTHRSPLNQPETIEETAELVTDAGGHGVAVQVDHMDVDQVRGLIDRISAEQSGHLDILVNDTWGGQHLVEWHRPFWEHNLENNLLMHRNAVDTHMITSWHAAPLLIERPGALIVEVTDGDDPTAFQGHMFYDVTKKSVIRLAVAQAEEMKPYGATTVALTPGFLRSEKFYAKRMTEKQWSQDWWKNRHTYDPDEARSESTHYVGRAIAALATDPNVARWNGRLLSSWGLAQEYGFTDLNGTRPLWGEEAVDFLDDAGNVIRRENYSLGGGRT